MKQQRDDFLGFGGGFDFGGNGMTDAGEAWAAMQIFEECTKEDAPEPVEVRAALNRIRNSWRDTCEDGSEYGLDPNNFKTEAAYNDALEEAQYGWRETCEDSTDYDVDPERYETEEEYMEALEEAGFH